MGLLDKLTAPFKGLTEWQKQQASAAAERERAEREQVQARRRARYDEVLQQFADAEHIAPKPYHELSIGEAKAGKTPALEYFQRTATVRVHNLMSHELMGMAALIYALGMRTDELEEGEIGEIVDVKPKDQASIEHGTVNLGPVPEFQNAQGTDWRYFLELSYTASASSGRGGILTRRFIADCTL
ncbi:MAG: hypothetical protein HY332_16720 [Chloroflexi bacterium]|nr:hypothetical protein [Chloroflexota bacterium]